MRFAPLAQKLAAASNELQVRSYFMDTAGELVGAKAWGIDLVDSRCRVMESELSGVDDGFRDRYQSAGYDADRLSQHMVQHHIPVHNLSIQSRQSWQQSQLYQDVFQPHDLEHAMVGPLLGNGRLIGGIYFLRDNDLPSFNANDLLQLSTLCQHLSVRLATLRLAIAPPFINSLTPREHDVVELVAQGLSNRAIGEKLHISQDAVKQTLKRLFQKLDVSARAELIAKLKQC